MMADMHVEEDNESERGSGSESASESESDHHCTLPPLPANTVLRGVVFDLCLHTALCV